MLDSKILDFARKWAKKASPAYADASYRTILLKPDTFKGKDWVIVTVAAVEGVLYLGVPQAKIDHPVAFDANALPKKVPEGEIVATEDGRAFIKGKGNIHFPVPTLDFQEAERVIEARAKKPEGESIDAVMTAENLAAVIPFASRDMARPVLTQLGFHPNGMVAMSDGYTLGAVKILDGVKTETEPLAPELPQAFYKLVAKKATGIVRFKFVKQDEALVTQVRGWLRITKKDEPVSFLVQSTGGYKYPDFSHILETGEPFGTVKVPKDVVASLKLAKVAYLLTDDEGRLYLLAESRNEDTRTIIAAWPIGEVCADKADFLFMAAYNADFIRKGFTFVPEGKVAGSGSWAALKIHQEQKAWVVMPVKEVAFSPNQDADAVKNTIRVLDEASRMGVKVDKLLSMLPVLDIPAEDETAFEAVAVPA
ncbi:MAG TPA: hypothetical protein ENJ54_00180 [Chloroflexi bacterium]|nr:hypothetical protein [Chloroflexota bacterium]